MSDVERELNHRIKHCDPELAGKTARHMLKLWRAGEEKQAVIDWVLFGTYPENWSFQDE